MSNQISVYNSAHQGDFDAVKKEVDNDVKLILKPDDNGRLLIHWAALSGNVKLVTYLIELDSPIDPVDDTDTTPLILAASAGRDEVVKILIKHGANVNHKNNQGHSALQYSCSKGWLEITLKLLEADADINIVDAQNASPLHRAASKGNLAIVKLLVTYKEKLRIDLHDNYGNTALHLACEEDRQEVAKLLVENGADLEAKNKNRETPLDLCSISLAKILNNLVNV